MSQQLSETSICKQLAEDVCQHIARSVIRQLQRMNTSEYLLSGGDSGLQNTWDEICVQVQGDYSYQWNAYQMTVETLVAAAVDELKQYEKEAIWLQSDEGWDWDSEDVSERDPSPVYQADIVQYLLDAHIYSAAGAWSNSRIEAFLNRGELFD